MMNILVSHTSHVNLLSVANSFNAHTCAASIIVFSQLQWTPSIKRTPALVPKFSSNIYSKIKPALSGHPLLSRHRHHLLSYFSAQNLQ